VRVYGYYVFPKPSVHGFPTVANPADQSCRYTSFIPLPCQAWHDYGVTNAHRVEVEVGADGHASASPSGARMLVVYVVYKDVWHATSRV
jgi:hypothetical protein